MPFAQVSRMESRRLLAHRVLVEGWSVSGAARAAGVSRQAAYRWLDRAQSSSIIEMEEFSRCPVHRPNATPEATVEELLALRLRYPRMGPKKLCAMMQSSLQPRTAARILARRGLEVRPLAILAETPIRFEREQPNELWQIDFKGINRRRSGYEVFSVIDDASRRCLGLVAMPDQRLESVWSALWEVFGQYGLPEAVLSDNGPVFGGAGTWRLSKMDARLLRLGIRPIHGRPYHPQTQGKVERFHGTLAREVGDGIYAPTLEQAQVSLDAFRRFYDWVRPHEALGQRPPATVYQPSFRTRPNYLPDPVYEPGLQLRKVSSDGYFLFKGTEYKAGKGLTGEWVGIDARANEEPIVWFCSHKLAPLSHLKVSTMSCPQM
jgi:transposase InsO family protein